MHAKVKFIIHFFLKISHFKEPCNFIGCKIWAHNWRPRCRVVNEISIKILAFTLDYFQEKLNTRFSKKYKKPYFGVMWPFSSFLPKFGEKLIFLEKRLCQFLNIPVIYHCVKNQKKLIGHS